MAPSNVIREDLVVRYKHMKAESKNPPTGMLAQTLPMASMFMRNKVMSWAAFSVCVQHYLNYRNVQLSDDANSPALSLVLAIMSVITSYMDILMPTPTPKVRSGAAESAATSVISSVVSSATSS